MICQRRGRGSGASHRRLAPESSKSSLQHERDLDLVFVLGSAIGVRWASDAPEPGQVGLGAFGGLGIVGDSRQASFDPRPYGFLA